MPRSPITTHVLDVARGRPAEGVAVMLEFMETGAWQEIAAGKTDADGRAMNLLPENATLKIGVYRLTFDTLTYQSQHGEPGFYPYVPVIFEVADTTQHFHVPLLLSPFGYSTYRGS
jgi:5-hydroxyisourate hydrolase